jgi:hypothetical protein
MMAPIYFVFPRTYTALKSAAACRHAMVGWDGPTHELTMLLVYPF